MDCIQSFCLSGEALKQYEAILMRAEAIKHLLIFCSLMSMSNSSALSSPSPSFKSSNSSSWSPLPSFKSSSSSASSPSPSSLNSSLPLPTTASKVSSRSKTLSVSSPTKESTFCTLPSPPPRVGKDLECIWCDGKGHRRMDCPEFKEMIRMGIVEIGRDNDGRLKTKVVGGEFCRLNFGKGGQKMLRQVREKLHGMERGNLKGGHAGQPLKVLDMPVWEVYWDGSAKDKGIVGKPTREFDRAETPIWELYWEGFPITPSVLGTLSTIDYIPEQAVLVDTIIVDCLPIIPSIVGTISAIEYTQEQQVIVNPTPTAIDLHQITLSEHEPHILNATDFECSSSDRTYSEGQNCYNVPEIWLWAWMTPAP